MSFRRLIFYSAMVGGWAAFVGWLLCELALMHRSPVVSDSTIVLTAAVVGALIGGGLNFLARAATGGAGVALPRLFIGLVAGAIGGALGCFLGNVIFGLAPWARALGWMVMGLGIGAVEGVTDLSLRKLRNGLIGGAVGGLLGGILFDIMLGVIGNPMSSRAVTLVILGVCIGLAVGLAQVVLREAWLTVEDGFRPGRQLLLSRGKTYMGTSEKAHLIFIAYGAKGVEPLHVGIEQNGDGTYSVADNGSRTGTFVNEQPIAGGVRLKNGDVIRLGINKVRFNERGQARGTKSPSRMDVESKPPLAVALAASMPPRASPAPLPVATPLREAKPAPVNVGPRPAPVPQRPKSMPAGHVACPVCGYTSVAKPGKRRCENCDTPF